MLVADKGCSVLPMGAGGADSSDWPGAAGTGGYGAGLLLPPPSSAAWTEEKTALGRLTIKVSFPHVYQD